MNDVIGLAEALLGLEGFRVLDVVEGPDELVVTVESRAKDRGLYALRRAGRGQDRMPIDIRDLTCFATGSAGVDQLAVALPRRRL